MLKLLILLMVIICSCSSGRDKHAEKHFRDLLKDADALKITFYFDSLQFVERDSNIIAEFRKLLRGGNDEVDCDTTGKIIFLSRENQLLEIYFSTSGTGGMSGCATIFSFFKPDIYKEKITYRVGRYLDETFNELRNKND